MQVVWRKSAIANLRDIKAYISLDDPMAGGRIAKGLYQAGRELKTFPNRGKPTGIDGIRELVVPGTPYLLVYRVTSNEVQILRIWHEAQDRP